MELLPTPFAHVVFPENIFPQVKSSMGDTTFIEQMVEWFPMLFPSETWSLHGKKNVGANLR